MIWLSLPACPSSPNLRELKVPASVAVAAVEAFRASFRLFFTKDMALLSLTFFYSGIELSFFSGVYSAAIGFTKQLGSDASRYVGISGMLIGAGEITGSLSNYVFKSFLSMIFSTYKSNL